MAIYRPVSFLSRGPSVAPSPRRAHRLDELRPVIPRRVGLHRSPLPLHRLFQNEVRRSWRSRISRQKIKSRARSQKQRLAQQHRVKVKQSRLRPISMAGFEVTTYGRFCGDRRGNLPFDNEEMPRTGRNDRDGGSDCSRRRVPGVCCMPYVVKRSLRSGNDHGAQGLRTTSPFRANVRSPIVRCVGPHRNDMSAVNKKFND
jgi:hypothetical protein